MDDLERKLEQRALHQPSHELDARMDDLFFDAATQSETMTARRLGPWSLVAASIVGVVAGFALGRYESVPVALVGEPSEAETYIYVIRGDDGSGKNVFEVSEPPRRFLSEPMEPVITLAPMDEGNAS